MTGLLVWVGRRAPLVMAVGVLVALLVSMLFEALSALTRPALPALLIALYALAIMRIDPAETLARALRPQAALGNLALCVGLMAGAPALLWALGRAAGLPDESVAAMVYVAAAPAVGSAASLCLLLGLDAALALQITVLSALLAPVIGPATAALLLGESLPIDPGALALRLGAMIGAGAALAVVARRLIGAERIAANAELLNGVTALTMVTFLVPLFDGAGALILAAPGFAAATLALAAAANFGLQALAQALLRGALAPTQSGAVSVIAGNRNIALYVAALPPDPGLALFVAVYQAPMYLTPLLRARLSRRAAQGSG